MFQNREQALTQYQRQIGRILNCVANAWAFTYPVGTDEYVLVSQERNTGSSLLRLKRGRETLLLDATQRIQIFDDDKFRISTRRYVYVLWSARANEREVDWHYHRRQNNSFEAHLHIRDDAKTTNHYLVDRHVPTGRVPLEDVVRFAVQELHVQPRQGPLFNAFMNSETIRELPLRHQLELQYQHEQVLKALGPECGPEKCASANCDRPRIQLGVNCAEHHLQMLERTRCWSER